MSSKPSPNHRCASLCRSGDPCPFSPISGSRFCFSHDPRPEIRARRHAARVLGGQHKRRYAPRRNDPSKPLTQAELRDIALRVTRDLNTGRLDIHTAYAILFACRTALQAVALANNATFIDSDIDCPPEYATRALGELLQIASRHRMPLKTLPLLHTLFSSTLAYHRRFGR